MNGEWQWGGSPLFRHANNPFGIKSATLRGIDDYGEFDVKTAEFIDGKQVAVKAGFADFPTLSEAFKAHALLLMSPRYRPAVAHESDPFAFAEALGQCGYATDPDYGKKLGNIIRHYSLNDRETLLAFAAPAPATVQAAAAPEAQA